MASKKSVFVVMSAEFFHPGHLNIIKVARKLGDVTIGLATDKFNANYKRLPLLSYEERKTIVENIKGVTRVVPQDNLDLASTLRELKPDYFVHGDDWKTGPLREVRRKVLEALQEWGGILVEPPYTKGISSTKLHNTLLSSGVTSESRSLRFRRLLSFQPLVRILEVHNHLTGLIAEHTQVRIEGKIIEFDAMWYSNLSETITKGKPGTGYSDLTSRIITVQEILIGTSKPLIVDCGSWNVEDQFTFIVRTLERIGVTAVAIDDRGGNAETSINESHNTDEQIHAFVQQISAGKKAQKTDDFSIIAGINTNLFEKDSENMLKRAQAYIEAGADAILILSNSNRLDELFCFASLYSNSDYKVPLLAAIPALNTLSQNQFIDQGIRGIVYTDHLLRAAYTNYVKTARMLLSPHDIVDVNELCSPISEIYGFVHRENITPETEKSLNKQRNPDKAN
jgi:phosphoenolpyruvate phosphomutase